MLICVRSCLNQSCWKFSSKVGMGCTGCVMAFLTVWDGSKQIRMLASLVAVAGRS